MLLRLERTAVEARAGRGGWGTTGEQQSPPPLNGHSGGSRRLSVQGFCGAPRSPHSHPAGSSDFTNEGAGSEVVKLPKAND